MKIFKIILLSAIAFTSVEGFATAESNAVKIVHNDVETQKFKVYGNCGMCKKTIESALKGVDGIKNATWNVETKMMEVTFDAHEITLLEIKEKIAEVGYDTEEVRADEDVYNELPGCCQYDRPAKQE